MTSGAIRQVPVQRLSQELFAPFGEVIGPRPTPAVTMPKILAHRAARFGRAIGEPPSGFDIDALDILHLWDPTLTLALGDEPPGIRYMVVHARPHRFHLMERHLIGSQTFIPLGGRPTLFALAPPADLENPEATPESDAITCFLLDGSCGVNLRPGTWHWTPIPVNDEDVAFVTMTRARVRLDDMWMVDLRQQLGLTFELILTEAANE